MNTEEIFRNFVEPSMERIGLFGISRTMKIDGRECVVTFKVSQNVLTEFDSQLSRYLAAVSGTGLPAASVELLIQDVDGERSRIPYPRRDAASVPDALAIAARQALGDAEGVRVRMGAWVNGVAGQERDLEITKTTLDSLGHALAVCRKIGDVDFLDISGNFERVLVRPADSDLDMVTIDLWQGTIDVPDIGANRGSAWIGPMFGFENATTQIPAITAYLSRARHAVATAKKEAILEFRDAAETQIMRFNAALAGRPLVDHRLERATSLVARLKAGLGSSLLGLSEAAQMTALDWVIQIDDSASSRPVLVS